MSEFTPINTSTPHDSPQSVERVQYPYAMVKKKKKRKER